MFFWNTNTLRSFGKNRFYYFLHRKGLSFFSLGIKKHFPKGKLLGFKKKHTLLGFFWALKTRISFFPLEKLKNTITVLNDISPPSFIGSKTGTPERGYFIFLFDYYFLEGGDFNRSQKNGTPNGGLLSGRVYFIWGVRIIWEGVLVLPLPAQRWPQSNTPSELIMSTPTGSPKYCAPEVCLLATSSRLIMFSRRILMPLFLPFSFFLYRCYGGTHWVFFFPSQPTLYYILFPFGSNAGYVWLQYIVLRHTVFLILFCLCTLFGIPRTLSCARLGECSKFSRVAYVVYEVISSNLTFLCFFEEFPHTMASS